MGLFDYYIEEDVSKKLVSFGFPSQYAVSKFDDGVGVCSIRADWAIDFAYTHCIVINIVPAMLESGKTGYRVDCIKLKKQTSIVGERKSNVVEELNDAYRLALDVCSKYWKHYGTTSKKYKVRNVFVRMLTASYLFQLGYPQNEGKMVRLQKTESSIRIIELIKGDMLCFPTQFNAIQFLRRKYGLSISMRVGLCEEKRYYHHICYYWSVTRMDDCKEFDGFEFSTDQQYHLSIQFSYEMAIFCVCSHLLGRKVSGNELCKMRSPKK